MKKSKKKIPYLLKKTFSLPKSTAEKFNFNSNMLRDYLKHYCIDLYMPVDLADFRIGSAVGSVLFLLLFCPAEFLSLSKSSFNNVSQKNILKYLLLPHIMLVGNFIPNAAKKGQVYDISYINGMNVTVMTFF